MINQHVPQRWLAWAEVPRALFAMANLPYHWTELSSAPQGDQRPVFVIPGIGMTDRSTLILRRYLGFLGYKVQLGNWAAILVPKQLACAMSG